MKRVFTLLVFVVAILLVLPGVVGMQAEERYQSLIDRISESGLQLVSHDYQSGWFGATAETRFQLPAPPSGDGSSEGFTLHSTLSHGPLTTAGLGLELITSSISVDGEPLFPGDYPAQIETLVALDGSGQTRIELPATQIEAKDGKPALRFDGLSAVVDFDTSAETLQIQATAAGGAVERSGSPQGTVEEMRLDSRSWRGESGVMIGEGTFTLRHARFNDPEAGGEIAIDGLQVEMSSSEQGQQTVSGIVSYRLDKLQVGDQSYGPGRLDLEMSQLSAAALQQLQQAIEQIRQQQMSEDEQAMAMLSTLAGVGPALLQEDPGFAIKSFDLVTPQGRVTGSFTLRPVGLEWSALGNSQAIIEKLSAALELRIPESMLQSLQRQQLRLQLLQLQQLQQDEPLIDPTQMDQLVENEAADRLQQWLKQGIVKRDGSDIITQATLSDGLLTVNGKSFPLAALFQQ